MEWYVQAQDAMSWTLHVRWGRLGLVRVGHVRSVSSLPGMIWSFLERHSVITKHVWSAYKVSWGDGGLLLLLLEAWLWRVLRAKWYYYGGDTIWSGANHFQAEIDWQGMICNKKLNYLKIFWLERVRGGGSRFCGPMNIIIFPKIRDGFEKNQLIVSFSVWVTTNVEELPKLVPSGRGSSVSWFLLAKFSNFFCKGR